MSGMFARIKLQNDKLKKDLADKRAECDELRAELARRDAEAAADPNPTEAKPEGFREDPADDLDSDAAASAPAFKGDEEE